MMGRGDRAERARSDVWLLDDRRAIVRACPADADLSRLFDYSRIPPSSYRSTGGGPVRDCGKREPRRRCARADVVAGVRSLPTPSHFIPLADANGNASHNLTVSGTHIGDVRPRSEQELCLPTPVAALDHAW